jgi:hypothetical protein
MTQAGMRHFVFFYQLLLNLPVFRTLALHVFMLQAEQQLQQQQADTDDSSQPEFLKVHSKISKVKLAS